MNYDLIVIGADGGLRRAIRGAQLGKKSLCGGGPRRGHVPQLGCIPTKSLLRNAELFSSDETTGRRILDFAFEQSNFDWSKVISRSRKVSDRLAGGIEFLFKKNKVDYVRGTALCSAGARWRVTTRTGTRVSSRARRSSSPLDVGRGPCLGCSSNGTSVIGSKDAMVIPKQPKDIIIIGAGAIGIEFAYFFAAFGTKVTVVEMMPNILPVETPMSVWPLRRFSRNKASPA